MFVELLGYLGSAVMVFCGIPQLVKTLKDGHAHGLSLGYLLMLQVGLMSFLLYVLLTTRSIPLLLNYSVNTVVFGVALYYKLRPRISK